MILNHESNSQDQDAVTPVQDPQEYWSGYGTFCSYKTQVIKGTVSRKLEGMEILSSLITNLRFSVFTAPHAHKCFHLHFQ